MDAKTHPTGREKKTFDLSSRTSSIYQTYKLKNSNVERKKLKEERTGYVYSGFNLMFLNFDVKLHLQNTVKTWRIL